LFVVWSLIELGCFFLFEVLHQFLHRGLLVVTDPKRIIPWGLLV
jgi:hypothetical protein